MRLDVVEFGEKPELWKEHSIRGTPTTLIRHSATGRVVRVEGFADRARLERALAELTGAGGRSAALPEGKKP